MTTAKIILKSIKNYGWAEIAYKLKFDEFIKLNPDITDENILIDKFHTDVILKKFQYGEYANIELIIDDNFNIIGGKIFDADDHKLHF